MCSVERHVAFQRCGKTCGHCTCCNVDVVLLLFPRNQCESFFLHFDRSTSFNSGEGDLSINVNSTNQKQVPRCLRLWPLCTHLTTRDDAFAEINRADPVRPDIPTFESHYSMPLALIKARTRNYTTLPNRHDRLRSVASHLRLFTAFVHFRHERSLWEKFSGCMHDFA